MADLKKLSQELMQGEVAESAVPVVEESNDSPVIHYAGKSVDRMSADEKKAYAMEQGWKPKEEWKGDTSKWTDFDEFADRHNNVYIRLEKAEKANEKTAEMLARQEELHRKTLERQEARYKKELEDKIKELNAQKLEARENLDFDKYEQINEEAKEVEKELKDVGTGDAVQNQQMIRETQRILNDWQSKNPWYGQDIMLTAEADKLAPYIGAKFKDATPEERLAMVEKEIKRKFPDEFRNKNQDRQVVDYGSERNGAAPRQTAKKFGVGDLDSTDKMLFERYKKNNWGIPKKQATPERLKESEDRFFEEIKELYDAEKKRNKN